MGTAVAGALLPSGVDGSVESVLVAGHKSIQSLVGGLFDCVRAETPEGHVIVGYVHDEGLLLGMETNWLASALFGRELVGPCVIVGGTSPDGEYDGDDYDLPSGMFQFLVGPFTEHVRRCLAESMVMTAGLEMLRQENLVTEEELGNLDRLLASNDNEGIVQWFEMAEERIAVFVSRREGSKLVREIEDFLKEV